MWKILIPVCFIILIIVGLSVTLNPETNTEVSRQEKVLTQPYSWAVGNGQEQGSVISSAYIVIAKKGDVIFSLNPDKKISPASLVKLVTAMVTLDSTKPSDLLRVHKEATLEEPTILKAKEGEEFTVEELLIALLVYSANDAAEILAEQIGQKNGGDRKIFINLMNEKIKRLGLSKTSIANPSGIDDIEQFSTVRELSIIAKYALDNYPDIVKIVKIKDYIFNKNIYHEKYTIVNWNSLIDIYPGVVGVKIGHTENSGHSTIVLSERDGEKVMAVLIGAPDRRARDLWTVDLLNSAFEQKGIKKFKVTRDMLIKRSFEWSKILF